jgi:hypothetical protein
VHHGINPRYLDRNYGGILVIWDLLFGTYQCEEEPVAYGVTHALGSYNPIWANLAPFRDVAVKARDVRGVANKIRVWFAHPGTSESGARTPAPPMTRAAQRKYDPRPPRRVVLYVFVHFALLTAGGAVFMRLAEHDPLAALIVPGAFLLFSALVLAAWIEGRRWAFALDLVRQLALVIVAAAVLVRQIGLIPGLVAAAGLAAGLAFVFVILRPLEDRSDRPKLTA